MGDARSTRGSTARNTEQQNAHENDARAEKMSRARVTNARAQKLAAFFSNLAMRPTQTQFPGIFLVHVTDLHTINLNLTVQITKLTGCLPMSIVGINDY